MNNIYKYANIYSSNPRGKLQKPILLSSSRMKQQNWIEVDFLV